MRNQDSIMVQRAKSFPGGAELWLNGVLVFVLMVIAPNRAWAQTGGGYPVTTAISAGKNVHAIALKSDGRVWAWGYNDWGQLGDGTTDDWSVPNQVSQANGFTNAAGVAGGDSHSLCVVSNGTVWAWGDGRYGQLGNGTTNGSLTPVHVTGLSNAVTIAAGGTHSLAISNGAVWAWGRNASGQLGIGNTNNSLTPARASGLANITAVAGGIKHSLALSNGMVWAWGLGANGELGNGTTNASLSAVQVNALANVTRISAGGHHSLALSNGVVWAWGANDVGQLGDGTSSARLVPVRVSSLSNVVEIAAGGDHSLGLRSDGTVWMWGQNAQGLLETGAESPSLVPVRVRDLNNVIAVSAGQDYSVALKSDGTVWTWGYNDAGELGEDTTQPHSRPVAVDGLSFFVPGAPNPLARSTRFKRGHGAEETYYSFVIPLDGEKGVKLNPIGGNADVLFKTNAWSNLIYHVNNSGSGLVPLPFKNPIVAFGSRVGGSSLYYNQAYNFGVYAGDPSANTTNAIAIEVYNKSDFSYVSTYYLPIPTVKQTNAWANFLTNGFMTSTNMYGLTTTLYFANPYAFWGTDTNGNYRLTHVATPTNYFYVVQIRGQVGVDLMVTQNSTNWWSRLYTLEFETRPAWRAVFVDQPHFDGEPMPSAYQGKSVEELLAVSAVVTNAVTNAPNTCLVLDQSPELRRHPILDQFVLDMGKDPLALVNYVLNEIGLTDGIAYNDNGDLEEASINLGGVNRSALGTYLEGQGSPTEQCALLVYLLRQAGVPACYIYPPHNGLQMLDARMSKLLRMQFRGLVNDVGVPIVPQMIPVNYPWVAAYVSTNNGVSTNWVHIFPWLKDTEIVEGLDLYKYMPSNYNSGFKWLKQYCLGDTNILSLATDSDTPLAIFPKFVQNALLANPTNAGLSVDDLGVKITDRRHYYSRWSDLPTPTSLTNTSISVESLGSSSIKNVSPLLTNIFDTVSVEVYSVANSNSTRIATGDMQMLDLHNRKFILMHEKVTNTQHRIILSLAPYRPDTTNPVLLASVHFQDKTDTNVPYNIVATNTLNSGDDVITINIIHKRHRALSSTNSYYPWDSFPGLEEYSSVTQTAQVRKGDLAAICFNVGRVSRRMLEVHAEEFWQMQAAVQQNSTLTNSIAREVYQGTAAYLMGMGYYERCGRFEQMNEALHKLQKISRFDCGLAKLVAKRVNGALPNGDITLIQPAVDMFSQDIVVAGNMTVRPDEGGDWRAADYEWAYMLAADTSAEEHQIINTYFKQAAAVSTVRLLQIAQTNAGGPGVLVLNVNNYANYGTSNYNGKLSTNDAAIWQVVTNTFATSPSSNFVQVLITPGAQVNSSGSYRGMGAMILHRDGSDALISANRVNGGFGDLFDDPAFQRWNIPSLSLDRDDHWNLSLSLSQPTSSAFQAAPDSFNLFYWLVQQNNVAYQVFNDDQRNGQLQSLYNLGITPTIDTQNRVNTIGINLQIGSFGLDSFTRQPGELAQDPVSVVTGEFHADELDLALPGPMPLQVRRNYSSHNMAPNQFGYGWKLNYMPYLSVSTNGATIYAADADGAVLAYIQTATNNTVWLPDWKSNPRVSNRTTAGIGSTANALNGRIQKETSGSTNFYKLYGPDGSLRTFQVMTFISTYTNSRPFLIKWQDAKGNYYLVDYGTDQTQPDFGQARRIRSSNGSFLGFYFDYYGHIIEAYTGDGRRIEYEYDRFGDLVAVTLPDASLRSYEYEHKTVVVSGTNQTYSSHLLLKEFKPDGRLLVNAYDSQRRVTNQFSTAGPDLNPVLTATFIYSNNFKFTNTFTNTISGYTIVKDALTNATRYNYGDGLITAITNPLGQAILQTWWAPSETNVVGYYPRALKQLTDRRGLITKYLYDANGNATNVTVQGDLTGNGNTNEQAVSSFLYDGNNLLTSSIDLSGNTNLLFYTNTWLLSRVEIRPPNSVLTNWVTNSFTYANVTNVFNYGSTSVTVMAFGVQVQRIRALNSPDAAKDERVVDGRGFITQTTQYTGTSDPDEVNQFFYNGRDELVEQIDGASRRVEFGYDDLGRPIMKEVYEAGGIIPVGWEYAYYNENGELEWSDGPAYGPEDYVFFDHDGAGRTVSETHFRAQAKLDGSGVEAPVGDDLFATTFSQWDAFGNRIKVTDPVGVVRTNAFDAIGQMVRTVVMGSNGVALSTNGVAYEAGGLVSFTTNALGGVTEKQYTSTGLIKYQKNPDGSRLSRRYYLDGRLATNFLSNGAYWVTTYDDARRRVLRSFYSPTNSLLETNRTELDRRGNVVRTVDAGGSGFTNVYDGLDRVIMSVGPEVKSPVKLGLPDGTPPYSFVESQTTYYGAGGAVVTNVNGLLEQTITYRDALQRPTRVEIRDADNNLIHEKTRAYSADHHSVTITEGSGTNAIVSTEYTDNAGHSVLSIQYPVAGSVSALVFTWRKFDVAGNQVESRQYSSTNGASLLWATNSATFDGFNRPSTQTVRDGATTSFGWDAAGNPTSRLMPGGILSWHALYNSASQKVFEYELGSGGASNRTMGFAYYATNSPFAGLLQYHTNGLGVVCTHYYDHWLRPSSNIYTGPLPEQNLITTWTYDILGRPTAVTEAFASSSTGPSTTITRSYDAYGELTVDTLWIDGQVQASATQVFDPAARRLGLSFGEGVYAENFVWQADGLLAALHGPTGDATYGYTTAGLLSSRLLNTPSGGFVRSTDITSRDGMGMPLTITNRLGYLTGVGEVLAWTGDQRLSTHSIIDTNFTDNRAYFYGDMNRRMIEERQNVDSSRRWTNICTYDGGQAGQVGVLSKVAQGASLSPSWSGGVDAMSRTAAETNSTIRRPAWGTNNGVAAISLFVDGNPMPVSISDTQGLQWRATLELTAGSHTVLAAALHPSLGFTAYATNTITVNGTTNDTLAAVFDNNGNTTGRTWKNGTNIVRTQTLIWDAHDRLVKVIERDSTASGYNWTGIYDALNRLLRTTEVPVTAGVTNAGATLTIDLYYDPSVQFLVLGVATNDQTTWKIMGPDLNGVYGGLNGLGGFEAIVPGPELFCPIVSDARGNLLVVNDAHHGGVVWNKSRPTGYGAVPGYRAPALGHGSSLVECCARGGNAMMVFGGTVIGNRVLLADIGQWASADQAGHDGSDNLMSYCGGDPINFPDVDGLCSSSPYSGSGANIGYQILDAAQAARDAVYAQGRIDMAILDARLQQQAQFNAIDAYFDARTASRHEADLSAGYDSYFTSLQRHGEMDAYYEQQAAQTRDNRSSAAMSMTLSDRWKYDRANLYAEALVDVENLVTLGAVNSGVIALTGSDLRGRGDYSPGERAFEGAMSLASAIPIGGLEGRAASWAAEGTVDLYRAVGVREFNSVMANKVFQAGGNSMSARQFGFTLEEALKFADVDPSKVAIIKATIPKSLLPKLDFSRTIDPFIFKNGVITVHPEMQPLFNQSLQAVEHAF